VSSGGLWNWQRCSLTAQTSLVFSQDFEFEGEKLDLLQGCYYMLDH